MTQKSNEEKDNFETKETPEKKVDMYSTSTMSEKWKVQAQWDSFGSQSC